MTTLLNLTKKAQQNDNEAINTIIEKFEPKIGLSLKQTSPQEQEDLYQELKIKTIEIVCQYDIESTEGFWEFKKKVERQQEC
ncbi:helix-turn-helix domain-containing protein [Halobacillus shinanisalinarum]|uniref:Helix-turn-helix domain-containing protein n=1 Tax=Halobacillus shinanisalinarum TaxID=2932258 RepID=A0ABY4GUK7_9BACI|nr:helix-turn-helix domain-containing protein [Halobacillus shinanisalinarum]UOQ91575.1 helix-turn-helix domain-containing protein [Halobacillus shinanisalinarum]